MRQTGGGLWSALAWLAFPLVPALLGNFYNQTFTSVFHHPIDPVVWDWFDWVVLTGPLVGYGFLAGATLDLPDEPGRRGLRGWLERRAVWVAVGPWVGFLFWGAVYHALVYAAAAIDWVYPASRRITARFWPESGWNWLLGWALIIGVIASIAYGWLFVAVLALRRARRLGRCCRAIGRGLVAALGFVGSLLGTFWAVTEAWRAYFFDPRIIPILVAAATLALTAGCAGTVTYGEVRRRELFQALFMAWLLGLALLWRWWRPRPAKPPGPG